MKAFFFLILVVLAVAAILSFNRGGGTDTPAPGNPAKVPGKTYPADKVWTAEEVSADPTGYMGWADAKVGKQLEDRESRLKTLNTRLAEIEKRQQSMRDNLRDTENIRSRLGMAIRRAEDEDRWPVQMGGRKFEKEEALTIMEQSARYIEDRRPLSSAYDTTVNRLRGMAEALKKEVGEFKRLREKMALDLEQVRLTQSMDDLNKLRKSEAEITGFAQALGTVADENLTDNLPDTKAEAKVDIDSFLKK
jgi:hypothetical protein